MVERRVAARLGKGGIVALCQVSVNLLKKVETPSLLV